AAEVVLVPRRVADEVAGDADADPAADGDRLLDLGDARVLLHAREPGVGRRLEAEEDVDLLRERAPLLHERRMLRDQVGARLQQEPLLPDPPAVQRARQLLAVRLRMAEEVVGEEDVAADGGEVVDDAGDVAAAEAAVDVLPDRAERAAVRAAARRLDQVDGPALHAEVAVVARDQRVARRQRDFVEADALVGARPRDELAARRAVLARDQARDLAQRPFRGERARELRDDALAVFTTDRVDALDAAS